MFTAKFWKGAAERAARSAAQGLIVLWGAQSLNVLEIDWQATFGLTGGYVLLSLLTSVAAAGVGEKGTASLTR